MNPEFYFWQEIADLLSVAEEIPRLGCAWRTYLARVEALRAEEITRERCLELARHCLLLAAYGAL